MKKILIILPLLAVLSVPINASSYSIARRISHLINKVVHNAGFNSLKKVHSLDLQMKLHSSQNYMKTVLLPLKKAHPLDLQIKLYSSQNYMKRALLPLKKVVDIQHPSILQMKIYSSQNYMKRALLSLKELKQQAKKNTTPVSGSCGYDVLYEVPFYLSFWT